LRFFTDRLEQLPQAVPQMLLALDFWAEEPKRVVIAGDPTLQTSRDLLRASHSVYQPGKVILGTTGPIEPNAQSMKGPNGQPTVFVCTGTACQPPTSNAEAIRRMLK
jgi:uncharacterized protein YyaL (SSP411 family)